MRPLVRVCGLVLGLRSERLRFAAPSERPTRSEPPKSQRPTHPSTHPPPPTAQNSYEVACRNAAFTDGYGASIERNDACRDESQSVVVKVVDNCPCSYPGNAFSNKRWCCGDSGAGAAHMVG